MPIITVALFLLLYGGGVLLIGVLIGRQEEKDNISYKEIEKYLKKKRRKHDNNN